MMNALILVDLQNDFMPGGALAVREGDQVVPVANAMMRHFPIVVATQDWHPADHGSFARNHEGKSEFEMGELAGRSQMLWPVHCVQGSEGAALVSGLEHGKITKNFYKGTRREVDSYSGFYDNGGNFSSGLAEWLREQRVDSVTVMGLATDYCVKFTALDALNEGFATSLFLPGCRGVDLMAGDIERAVAEMEAAGVSILSSAKLFEEKAGGSGD